MRAGPDEMIAVVSGAAALLALAPAVVGNERAVADYVLRARALDCEDAAITALWAAREQAVVAEDETEERRHDEFAVAVRGVHDPLALRDMNAVMRRFTREGRSVEDYIAALRADPPHLIEDIETLIEFGAIHLLWSDQERIDLVDECAPRPAWNGPDVHMPRDLAEAEARMLEIMPEPRIGGVMFGAATGLGKTQARGEGILADVTARRAEHPEGKLISPGRVAKLAAHYYAVPDYELADELAARFEEMGLTVYILRGRSAADPEMRGMTDPSLSAAMCWKDKIRRPAAAGQSKQGEEMCGSVKAGTACSALGLCHYSTQRAEIEALGPDVIVLVHSSTLTNPASGAALPVPLSLTFDENVANTLLVELHADGRG